MTAGKGDRQRPTDREKFSSGWDLAFGKNVKEIEADLVAPVTATMVRILDEKVEADESKPINKGQSENNRNLAFPYLRHKAPFTP